MKHLRLLYFNIALLLQVYECINEPANKTVTPVVKAQQKEFTTLVVPYTPVPSSLPFSSIMNFTYHSTMTNSPASSTTTTAETVTKTVMQVQQVTQVQKVTQTVTVSEEDQIDKRMKSCYRRNRKVLFTQYWIPIENEWDETNDGKRVYLGGGDAKKTKLLDPNKKEIATVSEVMYNKCKMEGTVRLTFTKKERERSLYEKVVFVRNGGFD